MVADEFTASFGPPDPAAAPEVHFPNRYETFMWAGILEQTGAGWFRDGFLYLFGEGLTALQPCLDAWSFLVPPSDDRMIVGRNAYGAIMVVDDVSAGHRHKVRIVDPFNVTYDSDGDLRMHNMVSNWLPNGGWYGVGLPTFLDDGAYQAWRQHRDLGDVRLDFDQVLGIKVPQPLGGELVADNLQLENIVEYYQSTGSIYAAALEAGQR
jgi:hypothetical protein